MSSASSIVLLARGSIFRELAYHAIQREKIAHETKSRFLANVSHEIRTPLTTIIGWADLVLGNKVSGDVKNEIKIIQSSAEYLLKIINDLLDFSKIGEGKLQLEQTDFSLKEVLQDVIMASRVLVKEKVKFITNVNLPNVDLVSGDSHRLVQVIRNFISNAAKFTKRGEIEFSVHEGGSDSESVEINFSVRDTGIGMTHDTYSKIFKPFVQADSSMSRRYGGTGLGLSICKELIQAMNGHVEVESTLGVGTIFRWNLLLKRARGAKIEDVDLSTSADLDSDLGVLNVLLVDDNNFNQKLIQKMLENENCKVSTASNGDEAIQHCDSKPFDLIFMDIQMPIRDGIEATRIIREKGNQTVIFGLTANSDEHSRQAATRAGMNEILFKPTRAAELRAALKRVRGSFSL